MVRVGVTDWNIRSWPGRRKLGTRSRPTSQGTPPTTLTLRGVRTDLGPPGSMPGCRAGWSPSCSIAARATSCASIDSAPQSTSATSAARAIPRVVRRLSQRARLSSASISTAAVGWARRPSIPRWPPASRTPTRPRRGTVAAPGAQNSCEDLAYALVDGSLAQQAMDLDGMDLAHAVRAGDRL